MIMGIKHFYSISITTRRFISSNKNLSSSVCDATSFAALYVHWPYCKRRCTYCNFNKYIDRNVNEQRMQKCLIQELKTVVKLSGLKRVSSIFFGGGTPSLASPETIASFINTVKSLVEFPSSGEITLEANPTSLETSRLKGFKDAGVNRLSLGVQTLKAEDLAVLGRDHTVEDSLRCLAEARKLYPDRVSVDVMFGRPGQTVHAWIQEIKQVLDVCDKHLSLYQLTLERGTHLFKSVARGTVRMPSPDDVATMYKTAVQILGDNGFQRYEVSNFARDTMDIEYLMTCRANDSIFPQKAYSEHNMLYWRGLQYMGIGPGAHSRLYVNGLRQARIQTLEPDPWMKEVETRGHGTRKIVDQTTLDHLEEILALGLRTMEGVTHERWKQVSSLRLRDLVKLSSSVGMYIVQGLLTLDDRGLRATQRGLDVLDTMIPSLLVCLEEARDQAITG